MSREGAKDSAGCLRRALTIAAWLPWVAGAAVLLAYGAGMGESLERANHEETLGFTRRVLSAADVDRFERRSEPYPWSVAAGLGIAGAVLVAFHRSRARFRDPRELRSAFRGEALALRRALAWAGALLLLVGAHLVAKLVLGWTLDTRATFPISIFAPVLHATGLPFALAFVATFAWAWCRAVGEPGETWLVGLLLLVLGNLVQGGLYEGFLAPFVATDVQYYSEALRVADARAWTASFDEVQATLSCHASTHPPFAVLLHVLLLRTVGLPGLAAVFVLLTSTAVPLFFQAARALGEEPVRARRMALLLAALPAVNVYGAVSLDGVVLAPAVLVLHGIASLAKGGSGLRASLAISGGLIAMNLLTFAGGFLLVSVIALGTLRFVRHGDRRLLLVASATLLVLALLEIGRAHV